MDTTVAILRQLWRYRFVVGLFLLLALVAGLMLAYRPSVPPQSRKYEVGAATARILVDTPSSQVIEVAPKGSETLGARASLLANLMAQGEVKAAIARRSGVPVNRLFVVTPGAIDPQEVTPQQQSDPTADLLSVDVMTNDAGEELPIIDVDAQAPTAVGAARLADSAVAGLQDYLNSKAAAERVPEAHRLRVRGLGGAQGRYISRGPGVALALVAVIFIFGFLCSMLLLFLALARRWRVDEEDQLEAEDDDYYEMEPEDEDAFEAAPEIAAEPAVIEPVAVADAAGAEAMEPPEVAWLDEADGADSYYDEPPVRAESA
jgi:hypothetical protein